MNAAMQPAHEWNVGDVIRDRYRLEDLLGEGATGAVFAAWDEDLGRSVAIKLPIGSPRIWHEIARLLEREAQLAAKLCSEHTVRLIDLERLEDGTPCSVMERLRGETLDERLDRELCLPLSEAVQLAIEGCAALAEMHAQGIVHRDIKPANLFLAQRLDGTTGLKLIDFGSSIYARRDGIRHDDSPVGTPGYMAPEQIMHPEICDHRTDLWALGMVLYETLTGELPFEAEALGDVFRRTISAPITPPRRLRPDCPAELEAIVLRCLERAPEARFEDAAALAVALAPFAADPQAASHVVDVARQCIERVELRHTLPSAPHPTIDAVDDDEGRPSIPLLLTRRVPRPVSGVRARPAA